MPQSRIADNDTTLAKLFNEKQRERFEIYSYRNAATILANGFPDQFAHIGSVMDEFSITKSMIRSPGGSKGPIASYVDTLFSEEWVETKLSADLIVKLQDAKKKDKILDEYTREGYFDSHRIDFVCGKVALDLEWNSKDQTYDRDLYAFSAFYEAGAIDVGIIITRGSTMDTDYFRSFGKVLNKDGTDGNADVYKKFGASTTWMGKLIDRLDAGRNGGCPILAMGITPNCVIND